MAKVETSFDIVTNVLERTGEPTNGNSSYIDSITTYMSKMQRKILNGSTIFETDVEESWVWGKAKRPIILTLEPAITGSATVTNGSLAITFGSAPTPSVVGWFFRVQGDPTTYKVDVHTAASTAAVLDTNYLGTSGVVNFTLFKLDYDIFPARVVIDSTNNNFAFTEGTSNTQFMATLTAGSYTPTTLAAELQLQLDAAGDGTSAHTVTYDLTDRRFTVSSDLAGGGVFEIWGSSGTAGSVSALPVFGFDDNNYTNLTTYTSSYPHGAIIRLVEPFLLYNRQDEDAYIYGLNEDAFYKKHPIGQVKQATPREFTKINETEDGMITVRFSTYPAEQERIEITYVPYPRDLFNNRNSKPIVPYQYADVLEFGASHFIFLDKEDSKADTYAALTKAELQTMKKHRQSQDSRTGQHFGEVIAREDKLGIRRRWRYGYTADD